MEEANETIQGAASHAANETILKLTGDVCNFFTSLFTWDTIFRIAGTLLIVIALSFIYAMIKKFIKKIPSNRLSTHHSLLLIKLIKYILYLIVLMYVLRLFGLKLSAIWGAAGIAGVALGFAAQTSVSNLISGIFLLTEKTLKVGDIVVVGGTTGTVDSINLLSIMIHTFDNQMVRIPNSSIIDSNFQNNSFFPVRRFLFNVSISYSSDMDKALEAILKVPDSCPCLVKNPEAKAWFDGFLDSGILLTLAVWFKTDDLITAKNQVYIAIKKEFDAAGIEIPFNQLDVSIKKEN